MIVDDLDVKDIAVFPAKADPPLIIDADAVLPLALALESFEPISWRNPEILESERLMQIQ
jgi:hypothetical protein